MTVQIGVRVPFDLWKRFRIAAIERGKRLNVAVAEALVDWLDKVN